MIKSFEDLEVYQLSISLSKRIYLTIKNFPIEERFVIVNQLMRAVTSIGANIAEGFGRNSTKEFLKFLYNSRGSLMEVRHFLILSKELDYLSSNEFQKISEDCNCLGIKLNNLINSLNKKL